MTAAAAPEPLAGRPASRPARRAGVGAAAGRAAPARGSPRLLRLRPRARQGALCRERDRDSPAGGQRRSPTQPRGEVRIQGWRDAPGFPEEGVRTGWAQADQGPGPWEFGLCPLCPPLAPAVHINFNPCITWWQNGRPQCLFPEPTSPRLWSLLGPVGGNRKSPLA